MVPTRRERRTTVWLAAAGTVMVFGYAALALVQILWLNPIAAVPGVPLEQIHDEMARAGESINSWFVVIVMGVGPLVAVFLLVVAVVRDDIPPVAIAIAYLTILVLGPLAYFVASFGPGMSLADAYGISGADYSPWARPLYAVSAGALIALIGLGVAATVGTRRRTLRTSA